MEVFFVLLLIIAGTMGDCNSRPTLLPAGQCGGRCISRKLWDPVCVLSNGVKKTLDNIDYLRCEHWCDKDAEVVYDGECGNKPDTAVEDDAGTMGDCNSRPTLLPPGKCGGRCDLPMKVDPVCVLSNGVKKTLQNRDQIECERWCDQNLEVLGHGICKPSRRFRRRRLFRRY